MKVIRVVSNRLNLLGLLLFGIIASSCSEDKLFREVQPEESGIVFSNDLTYNNDFNIFRYRNFYNGGGVGLGDFNNDGLLDIYLIGNMSTNRMFLNKGDLQFEDVTDKAGVGGSQAFSTGVSLADVDGDGWTDIYVCNSGDIPNDEKINELFINNGDGTFSERAEEFGLANRGFSTHAAFFDYDKDGDLDMYLMNNSYRAIGSFDQRDNVRHVRDSIGGDKLFRNDENHFVDISEQAGIYGSVIGFGLGVTVGDVNSDGWLDIYISNDFFERDYLYLNDQKGGFEEVLEQKIKSTSAASMGADMADLDNNGHPEIFVTDMLPDNNARIKTVTTFDSWDRYMESYKNGYWHQFTRNTLHYNNGDGTFSELGRYAEVEASDWSWASVIFDFQNDGLKDIFVANGIYQDLTNQDFLVYVTREEVTMQITMSGKVDFETLIGYIPSNPIPNQAFVNNGGLKFSNESDNLGLATPSFSSGSAYGDLDNDGDLDLVINNTNTPFSLYENQTEKHYPENRFIRFVLNGEKGNIHAIGARIRAYDGEQVYQLDNIPNRGFESTVDNRPLLGVGKRDIIERVEVYWPSGRITRLSNVETNQELILNEAEGEWIKSETGNNGITSTIFSEMDSTSGIHFLHQEVEYSDFDRDKLIFQMASTEGPCACSGDINNDGFEDIFIGGAAEQEGQVFAQQEDGSFREKDIYIFSRTKNSEDVSCELFDANGDGFLDLYVASGSNEFDLNQPELNDRLYFGDGNFGFELVRKTLPAGRFESSSVVKAADYDGDGDSDLFVGIRSKPYFYGMPSSGYILKNDGNGEFSNVSMDVAPKLEDLGMITDASWSDLDKDNDLDLIIVGEWMSIVAFINENGKFTLREDFISNSKGWWNAIEVSDVNGDGLPDLIVGNHGYNSRFRATADRPLTMFVKDFNGNGFVEQILCQYEGDKLYPMLLKHDIASLLPIIDAKYRHYESYKDQTVNDIFSTTELADALVLEADELATLLFINNGDLTFTRVNLPEQVQFSTINAISVEDYNEDGITDILLGGNFYSSKPEVGRYDASYGSLLIGDGSGDFQYMPPSQSGLVLDRQVREIVRINTAKGYKILAVNNDDYAQLFAKSE